MRTMRFILVLALALVFVSPALAKKASRGEESILGIPCAAIAQDGRWATGTFTPEALQLQISQPSGQIHRYDMSPVFKRASALSDLPGCQLFFSPDGRYLAASEFLEGWNTRRLRITVLNASTGKWISSFEVHPQGLLQSDFLLAGFLTESDKLVVTGLSTVDPKAEKAFFSSMLFSIEGVAANLHGAARPGLPDLIGGWSHVDAKHNRLWGFGVGTSTPCHWRSVTLTGPTVYGPAFDDHGVGSVPCSVSFFTAFPDEDTVVGADNYSNHAWAWKVDLSTGTGEKLQLPESRPGLLTTWNAYTVMGGSLSPDGQIFVIDRNHAEWNMLHVQHQKPDVLTALQVRPLRVLGTVQLKSVCPVRALAADHRNGQTKALIYFCGQWESLSIPPGPAK